MKKLLFYLLLIFNYSNLFAQQEIKYVDSKYQETPKRKAVYKMMSVTQNDTVYKELYSVNYGNLVQTMKHHITALQYVYVKTYYNGLKQVDEGWLISNSIRTGDWKFYNSLGKLSFIRTYNNGIETYYRSYYEGGQLKKEIPIVNEEYNGNCKYYNKQGFVILSGRYINLKRIGLFRYYNDSGVIIRSALYDSSGRSGDDSLFVGGKFSVMASQMPPKVAKEASDNKTPSSEIMPQFIGAEIALMKYITDNLVYPEQAKMQGVEGTVFIRFTVKSDGSISDVKIMNKDPYGYGLDRSAFELIENMPDWIPGSQNGVPVNVFFNIPIKFKMF